MFDQHHKKESPTFTGITRGVGGFGFGASSAAGGGGGGAAVDLASFFGVDPTASTQVKMQYLQEKWSMTYDMPTGGWNDFYSGNSVYGNNGTFISGVGVSAADNRGMWKTSANSPYDYNTLQNRPCDATNGWGSDGILYSTTYWNSSYSPTNVTDFTNDSNGGYITSGHLASSSPVDSYINLVFSNGLRDANGVNALGFVTQHYGSYADNYFSYHHNPIWRFSCNGVSATFAPKGVVAKISYTTTGTGRAGYVLYPCVFDDITDSDLESHFMYPNVSGTNLPSSYFVYQMEKNLEND